MRAETLPVASASLTDLYEAAAARSARLLLVASEAGGPVRVKPLRSTQLVVREEEVPRSEVVRHVVQWLAEKERERERPAAAAAAEEAAEEEVEEERVRWGRRRRRAGGD